MNQISKEQGMKQEGLLRRAGRCNQGIVDVVCYSIWKKEWEADRKGAQV